MRSATTPPVRTLNWKSICGWNVPSQFAERRQQVSRATALVADALHLRLDARVELKAEVGVFAEQARTAGGIARSGGIAGLRSRGIREGARRAESANSATTASPQRAARVRLRLADERRCLTTAIVAPLSRTPASRPNGPRAAGRSRTSESLGNRRRTPGPGRAAVSAAGGCAGSCAPSAGTIERAAGNKRRRRRTRSPAAGSHDVPVRPAGRRERKLTCPARIYPCEIPSVRILHTTCCASTRDRFSSRLAADVAPPPQLGGPPFRRPGRKGAAGAIVSEFFVLSIPFTLAMTLPMAVLVVDALRL